MADDQLEKEWVEYSDSDLLGIEVLHIVHKSTSEFECIHLVICDVLQIMQEVFE